MKESSFEVVEGKKQRQLQRKAAGVAFFWLQYIYIYICFCIFLETQPVD